MVQKRLSTRLFFGSFLFLVCIPHLGTSNAAAHVAFTRDTGFVAWILIFLAWVLLISNPPLARFGSRLQGALSSGLCGRLCDALSGLAGAADDRGQG